jgi:hypothetical protein
LLHCNCPSSYSDGARDTRYIASIYAAYQGLARPDRQRRFININGATNRRIAQSVEQLTLNQRVQGSSPCAPTNKINHLNRKMRFDPAAKSRLDNIRDNTLQIPREAIGRTALLRDYATQRSIRIVVCKGRDQTSREGPSRSTILLASRRQRKGPRPVEGAWPFSKPAAFACEAVNRAVVKPS